MNQKNNSEKEEMVVNMLIHHGRPYMWCRRCEAIAPVEDYSVKKLERKNGLNTYQHSGVCPECGDTLTRLTGKPKLNPEELER